MANTETLQPSLVEQIIAKMFDSLEQNDLFDSVILTRLKELAANDKLIKPDAILEVLRGVPHETD